MLRWLWAWARGNPIALAVGVLAWAMAHAMIDGLLLAALVWLARVAGLI